MNHNSSIFILRYVDTRTVYQVMLKKQEISSMDCIYWNVKKVFEEPKRPQMDVNKFCNSDIWKTDCDGAAIINDYKYPFKNCCI
jgi:hypothetical protein